MLLRKIELLVPSVTIGSAFGLFLALVTSLHAAAIPKGTKISIRVEQTMNSDRGAHAGDTFDAVLAREIRSGKEVLAPAGSKVRGSIVAVSGSAEGTQTGSISLRIESIETASATHLVDTETYTQRGKPPAGKHDPDSKAQAATQIADTIHNIGKPTIETNSDPNVSLETSGPVAIVAQDLMITFKLRAPSREIAH